MDEVLLSKPPNGLWAGGSIRLRSLIRGRERRGRVHEATDGAHHSLVVSDYNDAIVYIARRLPSACGWMSPSR